MTWHIVGEQLDAYLSDRLDAPTAASVEAHLVVCGDCRSRLARRTPAGVLAASWQGVERRIDAEPTGAVERLLTRTGVSERHQRLLAPTVPLRLAWLGAIAAASASAALLVREAPPGGSLGALLYLTLAAIVPLAAVAASLGTVSEPAPEVAVAAPLSAVQVLGLRASAVLLVTVAITLAAGTLLPGPWTGAALWLTPSLAMCVLTTALSGRLGPVQAATVVGVAWVAGVTAWVAAADDWLAPFRAGPQLGYLVLAALGAAAVLHRPDLMEPVPANSARRAPRNIT
jgi:hypothetical protein